MIVGHIIYNSHILYDDHVQYGGILDDVVVTNSLVENKKTINKALDTKIQNKLIDRVTINETHYWRIYAGMPMGLLLSLTYPVDQDGEIRT
jgi:hypothetical protein